MRELGTCVTLLIATIIAAGCAGNARRYEPPKASDSTAAVVHADGVRMKRVNGAKLEDSYTLRLTPGPHTIEFIYNQKFPGYSTQNEAEVTYTFAAGQKLSLTKKFIYANDPGLKLTDEATGQEQKAPAGGSLFKIHE